MNMNMNLYEGNRYETKALTPISLNLEGSNPDKKFTEVFLHCLQLVEKIQDSELASISDRSEVEVVFNDALNSGGRGSLLLKRVIETLLKKVQSGVKIENLQFMIQNLEIGSDARLFGQNSLTEHQSSEFAVLLMLGIDRIMAEEFKINIDSMNVMEVYWFLQWVKFQDSSPGSMSGLLMTRDEFVRLGIWQTFARVASLCQQSEGFDTLQRLENVIHSMNSNDTKGDRARSLMQAIEQYLDEIQRVTQELIEAMIMNEFDNAAVAEINDALLSRLRNDVYTMITRRLSQIQSVETSLLSDSVSRAQYGTRIAIARELNHYIATNQGALDGHTGSETELFMKLLNVEVEDIPTKHFSNDEKKVMQNMFKKSREEELTPEEIQIDMETLTERLKNPTTQVRIVRDKTQQNRLLAYVCYTPDTQDPKGVWVNGLTFSSDSDIARIRGILTIACFDSLAENSNVYFRVYRGSRAYKMYQKRFDCIEDQNRSNSHFAIMKIAAKLISRIE